MTKISGLMTYAVVQHGPVNDEVLIVAMFLVRSEAERFANSQSLDVVWVDSRDREIEVRIEA